MDRDIRDVTINLVTRICFYTKEVTVTTMSYVDIICYCVVNKNLTNM